MNLKKNVFEIKYIIKKDFVYLYLTRLKTNIYNMEDIFLIINMHKCLKYLYFKVINVILQYQQIYCTFVKK